MTVLPVTVIASGATPDASRLIRARAVGARCRLAIWLVNRRLISSGNGLYRLSVRSPASRCATGICA